MTAAATRADDGEFVELTGFADTEALFAACAHAAYEATRAATGARRTWSIASWEMATEGVRRETLDKVREILTDKPGPVAVPWLFKQVVRSTAQSLGWPS